MSKPIAQLSAHAGRVAELIPPLDLLDEMKHRGIEPNVTAYSAIIKACFDSD